MGCYDIYSFSYRAWAVSTWRYFVSAFCRGDWKKSKDRQGKAASDKLLVQAYKRIHKPNLSRANTCCCDSWDNFQQAGIHKPACDADCVHSRGIILCNWDK